MTGEAWWRDSHVRCALVAAAALVVVRSAVFVFYEQAHFDSDQAVTGLMARDIARRHALPVFFYGQQYLLAVEAWLAAPFILALGTSVAALKLPVLLLNIAAVWLLIRGFVLDEGLTPGAAVAATLFLAMPPPLAASRLVEAVGCNVEPFVFVLVLWTVRARPAWWGAILATGYLTREFVIYGAVALAIIAIAQRRSGFAGSWRFLARASVAFATVTLAVRALSRIATNFDATKSSPTLSGVDVAALPAHLSTLATEILPALFGTRADALARFNISSTLTAGHAWLGPVLLAGLAVVAARLAHRALTARAASTRRARAVISREPFALYLLLVGLQSALAFTLISNTDAMQVRYTLLALFIPAALVALHLRVERSIALKLTTVTVTLLWAGSNGLDHVRLIAEYQARRPANAYRELALYLESNGLIFGEADYWTAYHVTYLTDARVILTPRSLVRIAEYDQLVAAHAPTSVRISAAPCPGGTHLRHWYICR